MIKKLLQILYFILTAIFLLFVIIHYSCFAKNNETPESTPEPTVTVSIPIKPEPIKPTETKPIETVAPTQEPESEIEPTPEPEQEPELIMYYTEKDVIALAKVFHDECRGIPSDVEKACVGWVACNRVDAGYADTIYEVLTAPNQFAYRSNAPVTDELYNLALDVLTRWNNEKNGIENVGRVLPSNYLWFHGDGEHNYFRDKFNGNFNVWNYSLDNPYKN